MYKVLLPFILSLIIFPGSGQLYNGEKKKGFCIMAFLLIIIFAFGYFISQFAYPLLGENSGALNISQIRQIMADLYNKYPRPFFYYNLILFIVWIYSSLDAGFVAYSRYRNEKIVKNSSSGG